MKKFILLAALILSCGGVETITPELPTPAPINTFTPMPSPTAIPKIVATPPACDPAYPDFCIPSPPPDLNCKDIPQKRFTVLPPDPHKFDKDQNGVGCEN